MQNNDKPKKKKSKPIYVKPILRKQKRVENNLSYYGACDCAECSPKL